MLLETDISTLIQLKNDGRLGRKQTPSRIPYTPAMVRQEVHIVNPNPWCISDTRSNCEPWEDTWAPSVTISCLTSCISALSSCSTVRVAGADWYDCNGDYDRLDEQASWSPNMPVYKLRHSHKDRYLFSRYNEWAIGPSVTSMSAYHRSYGECCVELTSIFYPQWLQDLRRCANHGKRAGLAVSVSPVYLLKLHKDFNKHRIVNDFTVDFSPVYNNNCSDIL